MALSSVGPSRTDAPFTAAPGTEARLVHPGDDPAAAARFLGWLQGRGEPLALLDRDMARITELLAWHLGPDEIATLPLEGEERERVARRIALWREMRATLPADWAALGGKDPAQWLSAPAGAPEAPASPPPRLIGPVRGAARMGLVPLASGVAALAVTCVAVIACAALVVGLFTSRPSRAPDPADPQPLLVRDLALKQAMAETLACRLSAAELLVAARSAQLEALAGPACEGDPVACLDRREGAGASLLAAREYERATVDLARRAAPLPATACPSSAWPRVLVEERDRLEAAASSSSAAAAEGEALARALRAGAP